jgi:hypothetical protein
MDHSKNRLASGSDSSRDEFVLASTLALVAAAGLCVAFGLGFWVRGLIDGDVGRSARAGPELAAAGQPLTSHPDHPDVVNADRAEPERPAETQVKTPEGFVLSHAAPRASLPFVLPENPSFAVADLKLDEPAGCGQTEQVCAVDRSLNTALTWAKSPGAASEQARKEGKLVFLIHLSGNFEDPGFT